MIEKVSTVNVAGIEMGRVPFFLIAGPCVIEDADVMHQTAAELKRVAGLLNIPVVFKSSFCKDNRSSAEYYRGPGLEKGLEILAEIKAKYQLPILTDIHYPYQAEPAAKVADIIQIPAYLCMQSELTEAASLTKAAINFKHGQFLAPENMQYPVKKAERQGNNRIILTERGYTFGYNDLVVDMRSLYALRRIGYPVVFDVTHAVRRYGIPSADPKGGNREFLPILARAGVAAGVDGLFVEVHPDPPCAKCDAASQLYLSDLENFLRPLLELNRVVKGPDWEQN